MGEFISHTLCLTQTSQTRCPKGRLGRPFRTLPLESAKLFKRTAQWQSHWHLRSCFAKQEYLPEEDSLPSGVSRRKPKILCLLVWSGGLGFVWH